MSAPTLVTPTPALEAAEAAYQAAVELYERRGTTRAYIDEQRAWDAYAEVCNDLDKCLQPGCLTLSPTHAWCVEHRA